MKPSQNHPNCRPHNWLAYFHHDRSLERASSFLKGSVIDFGAGAGSYRNWCLKSADEYIAVDWHSSAHHGHKDVIADLNLRVPLNSEIADTVISFSVLEHLYNPERALAEAYRVLRPGGSLLLQVPWQWWLHEEPHDYYRYTPYAISRLLTQAGFHEINIEAQGGFFTTIFLKMNYFTLRFVKGPRFIRKIIGALFWLPWQLTQVLALMLDRLDRHKELEAPAYFVSATRPITKAIDVEITSGTQEEIASCAS